MGSKQRQEAIANGKIVENAEAVRRRRRTEAAIMREELAIELFAQGKKVVEIEEALFERYGVRCHGNIPAMIRRGLYRRLLVVLEAAVELLNESYRQLLGVYMPRALGLLPDPDSDTGRNSPPDLRAAEFALRVLDKVGEANGVKAPPRAGNINLNVINGVQLPEDPAAARALALQQLDRARDKQREIEGALGHTAAVAGAEEEYEDGMVPLLLPPRPTGDGTTS